VSLVTVQGRFGDIIKNDLCFDTIPIGPYCIHTRINWSSKWRISLALMSISAEELSIEHVSSIQKHCYFT
jgi:hypothetical protein